MLDSIQQAHQAGFHPIKINVVPIKGLNDDEIDEFAGLTVGLPFQVRFIELMPFEKVIEFEESHLSNQLVEERLKSHFDIEPVESMPAKTDGPARICRIKGAAGEIGFISPVSEHLCSTCNRLRLTAEGHLRACLFSDEETDLKGPLRAGCSDQDLKALIRKAILSKLASKKNVRERTGLRKCAKPMASIGG